MAIDAERASGYRYSNRAYLIQLRREGAGTWLVDPIGHEHPRARCRRRCAAPSGSCTPPPRTCPCLAEVGLHPDALFDTELAGRLLHYPRVGLATLVETVLGLPDEEGALGLRLVRAPAARRRGSSTPPSTSRCSSSCATPWPPSSRRPARPSGRARSSTHLRGFTPTPRVDAWRRTSGMHRARGRRALGRGQGAVGDPRRDRRAARRDAGADHPRRRDRRRRPGDATDRDALLATRGFHGRGAERYAARWVAALREVAELPEDELPARAPRGDGPPTPRAWAERDPVAARRLVLARESVGALAEQHDLPVENLLTPDYLRRILWTPPATREPAALDVAVRERLAELGARPWQVDITAPAITAAVLAADEDPTPPPPDALPDDD